jgi:hypothetical protein
VKFEENIFQNDHQQLRLNVSIDIVIKTVLFENVRWKGETSSDVIWSKEQMESLLNLYDNVFIVRILHFGGNNLSTNLHETCYLI